MTYRTPPRAQRPAGHWRGRLHEIIFEADTRAGRAFDLLLIAAILASIATIMLDSIAPVQARHGQLLGLLEWLFTGLFSLEYLLRLTSVARPWSYATSFFGLVDLLAVAPSYVGLLAPGGHALLAIRALRLLRVFRVLKLGQYLGEGQLLWAALRASRRKITVFLFTVLNIVIIVGAAMYMLEGGAHGFDSIPRSVYWAIVTLTTVGYGDIAPRTAPGQALAAMVMVLGYAIIAVPTGIVTSELTRQGAHHAPVSTQSCPACSAEGHDADARFCKHCGAQL